MTRRITQMSLCVFASVKLDSALCVSQSVCCTPSTRIMVLFARHLCLYLCLLWALLSITVATVDTVLSCGDHSLAIGNYTLQSANYPQKYPNGHDCSYSLTPANGGSVRINCTDFNVQPSTNCRADYLRIDGVKHCGRTPPVGVFGTVDLHFHTNARNHRTGFSCLVMVTADTPPMKCGHQTLDTGEYYIESPGYPFNYPPDTHCSYQLTSVESDANIDVACVDFDVDLASECAYDMLDINGVSYCGQCAPTTTSVGYLNVDFISDGSVSARGFRCRVSVTSAQPPSSSGCCCGIPSTAGVSSRHGSDAADRIMNGYTARRGEFPWLAALMSGHSIGEPVCSAVVISDRYLLTAASCVYPYSYLDVLVGEYELCRADGEQRYVVDRVSLYPQQPSDTTFTPDVALLHVSRPIVFPSDSRVAPICLPPADSTDLFVDSAALVSGWGATDYWSSSAQVQAASTRVMNNTECGQAYGSSAVDNSTLCTEAYSSAAGVCYGDDGSPLVVLSEDRYVLVGVASTTVGCGYNGVPDVYTRVTAVADWIRNVTSDSNFCG